MVQAIIQDQQCYPQLREPHESWLAPKFLTAFGGLFSMPAWLLLMRRESTGTKLTTAENLQKNSEMDFVDKWIDPILSVNLLVSQIQPHSTRFLSAL